MRIAADGSEHGCAGGWHSRARRRAAVVIFIDACQSGGAVEPLSQIAAVKAQAEIRKGGNAQPIPNAGWGFYRRGYASVVLCSTVREQSALAATVLAALNQNGTISIGQVSTWLGRHRRFVRGCGGGVPAGAIHRFGPGLIFRLRSKPQNRAKMFYEEHTADCCPALALIVPCLQAQRAVYSKSASRTRAAAPSDPLCTLPRRGDGWWLGAATSRECFSSRRGEGSLWGASRARSGGNAPTIRKTDSTAGR